ncbi:DnaD domain-containing protein [Candidatus Formimonas warabiya]|uniref:DnaB/C C-terminal domain-containing protein n=1 Tax=Formimonas warabiya TaxID=1761012 RepID=A0A3G1KNW5_FORW1|nr:DnaD domain protein [Candidatus Formimonas warabiya]ATW24137.1 hypothetical protein DCMF_04485 [Candidatus Formimonas warabiya]
MNYIKEINAFYDWLETNSISDSCIVLWHALMHICNKAGWVTEFAVAISTLETKTGLKKDAIIRARQRLQQSGRIIFKSRSGQQSALYIIIPFEINCVVLNDTNYDTNCNANRAQSATQTTTQTASIIKLNDIITTPTIPACEEFNIFKFIERELGYPLSSTQMDMIMKWQGNNSDELIKCAVAEALAQNVRTFAYIDKIILSWETSGIKTIQQVSAAKEEFQKRREKSRDKKGRRGQIAEPKKEEKGKYNWLYENLK